MNKQQRYTLHSKKKFSLKQSKVHPVVEPGEMNKKVASKHLIGTGKKLEKTNKNPKREFPKNNDELVWNLAINNAGALW